MKKIKSWLSASLQESQQIAKELSTIFKTGDIVLMEGNLGSGKTFLVQEICKNLKVKENVTSPTFTLIQNYSGNKFINHMDFYRLENINELDQLGWEEMIFSDALTFIEWPQLAEKIIPVYYKITIEFVDKVRRITLWKKA